MLSFNYVATASYRSFLCSGVRILRLFNWEVSGWLPPVNYFSVVCAVFCSLTDSPGEDAFQVKITSSSGRVRAWVQKLDRHDGSFIIRYRLFASYPDLTIEITHKGKNVANSPYTLQGLFLLPLRKWKFISYFIYQWVISEWLLITLKWGWICEIKIHS